MKTTVETFEGQGQHAAAGSSMPLGQSGTLKIVENLAKEKYSQQYAETDREVKIVLKGPMVLGAEEVEVTVWFKISPEGQRQFFEEMGLVEAGDSVTVGIGPGAEKETGYRPASGKNKLTNYF